MSEKVNEYLRKKVNGLVEDLEVSRDRNRHLEELTQAIFEDSMGVLIDLYINEGYVSYNHKSVIAKGTGRIVTYCDLPFDV